jgi:hypothetical protein
MESQYSPDPPDSFRGSVLKPQQTPYTFAADQPVTCLRFAQVDATDYTESATMRPASGLALLQARLGKRSSRFISVRLDSAYPQNGQSPNSLVSALAQLVVAISMLKLVRARIYRSNLTIIIA